MPGAIMAMARLDRPSLMVYGGTIAPGHYKGEELNIVSAFEALGATHSAEIFPMKTMKALSNIPAQVLVLVAECIPQYHGFGN